MRDEVRAACGVIQNEIERLSLEIERLKFDDPQADTVLWNFVWAIFLKAQRTADGSLLALVSDFVRLYPKNDSTGRMLNVHPKIIGGFGFKSGDLWQ